MACAVRRGHMYGSEVQGSNDGDLFMELGQHSEVSDEVKMRAELRTRA